MFTIVVFSQKGGSGKSTIAIHLAVMAAHSRNVMLINADPQGTAYAWGRLRGQRFDRKHAPIVSREGLTRASQAMTDVNRVGMVVIDCLPNADQTVDALAGGGLVSPYFFGNRLDFPRSLASGDPVLDACDHYSKPVLELREY